jgi:hypothetical protein
MKSNTKKLGFLSLILIGIIGTSFLKDNEKDIIYQNYRLNNKIISQIQTDTYLQKKEAQRLINSLGLEHSMVYDSAKFNFYPIDKKDIAITIEYKIPDRTYAFLKVPIGNVKRKTLQQYLYSKENSQ